MKTLKYLTILASILLLVISCTKDWVEIDQKGNVPIEEFYKTDGECLSALAAVYDMIQTMNAQDWASLFYAKWMLSDEVSGGGENEGDQPEYHEMDDYVFSASNTKINSIWGGLYFAVYRANILLERVDGSTDAQKIMLAEAKALRAYLYFELVNLFGDVPLVLTTPASTESYYVTKSTSAEIYDQIEKDLKEAITDLPERNPDDKENIWRIKKGFAQAMLGKALIFQKKYSEALPYLQEVITSGKYGLVDDYDRVIKYDTEFGKESLFEIEYSTTEGNNWSTYGDHWNHSRRQEENIHWILAGPRGDFFEPGSLGMYAGWGGAPAKQRAYDFFNADDPRREYNILSEEELKAKGGSLRNKNGNLQFQGEGYLRLKYTTWTDESGTNNGDEPGLNIGTNLRIMRYAEVLLLAAEAYVNTGDGGSAATEINKVRGRPSVNYTTLSTATMDDVKYERRCELCFEGHRFYDLVRWGDAETTLGSLGFTSKHEKFPIPQAELDANPKLVQNDPWK